ncbi:MAG: MBL fold metallo-hydrolase [Ignavibacteria bacterium]|nr:MBL fold metallo-hydrolase [Ignavibacteria bacterium]MBT8383158.1 MBL fold metallo-hydrolase [Ignavibacteria bacterium]MBT8391443.1 MBL fold metallo-hydrolase [Ignavibacteria bacterium]NNJ51954.1 MBL fold metallo-hydrolase [Ignavibacteriaceae bacterium]NNL21475.1 MBL fold metallo-hydrolase [Ignavibacteriaceae bacterium]
MKVTFLGTGSGKTSLKRFHSSLLFSLNDYNLLIDAGDGISRALLNANVNYNSINGILFTHLHPDHFTGLGALIVQMKMFNRVGPLEIYIYEKYVEDVNSFLLRCNIIPEKMDFKILYKPFSDKDEFTVNDELKILPRENSHLSGLKRYIQYSNRTFYAASFLFSHQNKRILYTADIGSADDLGLFKEFEVDVLISEITHITISELSEKIKLFRFPKTYLTHITDGDEAELAQSIKNLIISEIKVELATDKQTFEF